MEYTLSNVRNDFNGYSKLIDLYDSFKSDFFEDIEIEILDWFDANLSAVLGGILDKLANDGLNTIKITNVASSIQVILQKNNFLYFYGYPKLFDTYQTTIEYKKLKPTDSRYFNEYLEHDLLNRSELPTMSDAFHEKISESIQEMFVNATMHSESEFIYTCGQFHPARNELNFTIVDTGIGFAKRIEKDLDMPIDSINAILWAIKDGHTSKNNVSGGLGLAILKEFIMQNQGKIIIITGDAFYELNTTNEYTRQLNGYFNGSVISMTFNTSDSQTYEFLNEDESIDLMDLF